MARAAVTRRAVFVWCRVTTRVRRTCVVARAAVRRETNAAAAAAEGRGGEGLVDEPPFVAEQHAENGTVHAAFAVERTALCVATACVCGMRLNSLNHELIPLSDDDEKKTAHRRGCERWCCATRRTTPRRPAAAAAAVRAAVAATHTWRRTRTGRRCRGGYFFLVVQSRAPPSPYARHARTHVLSRRRRQGQQAGAADGGLQRDAAVALLLRGRLDGPQGVCCSGGWVVGKAVSRFVEKRRVFFLGERRWLGVDLNLLLGWVVRFLSSKTILFFFFLERGGWG